MIDALRNAARPRSSAGVLRSLRGVHLVFTGILSRPRREAAAGRDTAPARSSTAGPRRRRPSSCAAVRTRCRPPAGRRPEADGDPAAAREGAPHHAARRRRSSGGSSVCAVRARARRNRPRSGRPPGDGDSGGAARRARAEPGAARTTGVARPSRRTPKTAPRPRTTWMTASAEPRSGSSRPCSRGSRPARGERLSAALRVDRRNRRKIVARLGRVGVLPPLVATPIAAKTGDAIAAPEGLRRLDPQAYIWGASDQASSYKGRAAPGYPDGAASLRSAHGRGTNPLSRVVFPFALASVLVTGGSVVTGHRPLSSRPSSRVPDARRLHAVARLGAMSGRSTRSARIHWCGSSVNGRAGTAEGALASLAAARRHAIDPEDYGLTSLVSLRDTLRARKASNKDRGRDLARFDVLVTHAMLALGRDVAIGQTRPSAVEPRWKARRTAPPLVDALDRAIAEGTLERWLERVQPPHAEYVGLQRAWNALAAKGAGDWPVLPNVVIKPGQRHPFLAILRARFVASGELSREAGGRSAPLRFRARGRVTRVPGAPWPPADRHRRCGHGRRDQRAPSPAPPTDRAESGTVALAARRSRSTALAGEHPEVLSNAYENGRPLLTFARSSARWATRRPSSARP